MAGIKTGGYIVLPLENRVCRSHSYALYNSAGRILMIGGKAKLKGLRNRLNKTAAPKQVARARRIVSGTFCDLVMPKSLAEFYGYEGYVPYLPKELRGIDFINSLSAKE